MLHALVMSDVWCGLRHNLDRSRLCALIASSRACPHETIGTGQLFLVSPLRLPDRRRLLGASWLAAGVTCCSTCLVVLHDGLVDHVSTIHQLALPSTAI